MCARGWMDLARRCLCSENNVCGLAAMREECTHALAGRVGKRKYSYASLHVPVCTCMMMMMMIVHVRACVRACVGPVCQLDSRRQGLPATVGALAKPACSRERSAANVQPEHFDLSASWYVCTCRSMCVCMCTFTYGFHRRHVLCIRS